jgi:protein-L-isoaspartate(D-aspartate) O-methyltransferase
MPDFPILRQRMVDNQLRTGSVTDHEVLRAFLNTPREKFVAEKDQAFAYADTELKLPATAARVMMPPVQLARMIQALPQGPEVRALVVGCGTGFSATILARLAGSVVALEEDAALLALARKNLEAAANVEVAEARLADGYARGAPYDAILVEGAVEVMPDGLIRQLAPEGVAVAIERDRRVSRATLYERVGDGAAKWPLFDAWGSVLPGFAKKPEFVF